MGCALDEAAVAREKAILYPIERHRDVAALVAVSIELTFVADYKALAALPVLIKSELDALALGEISTSGHALLRLHAARLTSLSQGY